MQIFVKTLKCETVALDVESSDTVEAVRHKLSAKRGIEFEAIRLTFAGRQMEDTRQLHDYNVQRDATLCMVLRLRGGMFFEGSGGPAAAATPAADAPKTAVVDANADTSDSDADEDPQSHAKRRRVERSRGDEPDASQT